MKDKLKYNIVIVFIFITNTLIVSAQQTEWTIYVPGVTKNLYTDSTCKIDKPFRKNDTTYYCKGKFLVKETYTGLPDNNITALVSKWDGTLFIGTDKGIVIYKDNKWNIYNSENSSLPEGRVTSLIQLSDGRIEALIRNEKAFKISSLAYFNGQDWIPEKNISNNIYSIMQSKNGVLNYIFNGEENISNTPLGQAGAISYSKYQSFWNGKRAFNCTNSILSRDIYAICPTRDSSIYIGTSNGIVRYITNSIVPVNIGLENKASVKAIFELNDNKLFVGYSQVSKNNPAISENGIMIYYGGKASNFIRSDFDFYFTEVYSTIQTTKGDIYIATDRGLICYKDSTTVYKYDFTNSKLPCNRINSLSSSTDGKVYVGTDGGLVVINGSNWEVYNTLSSGIPTEKIKKILGNNQKICIGFDDLKTGIAEFDGKKWIAHNMLNLLRTPVKDGQFLHFTDSIRDIDNIKLLHYNKNGEIYITFTKEYQKNQSLEKDFCLYHYNQTKWDKISFPNIEYNTFMDLSAESKKGELYFCTSEGIGKYYKNEWQFYNEKNSCLPYYGGVPILNKQGELFIVYNGRKIIRFDEMKCGEIENIPGGRPFKISGKSTNRIYVFLDNSDRPDKVASFEINQFVNNDIINSFIKNNSEFMLNNNINAIYESGNNIYIATYKGLVEYKGKVWHIINTDNSGIPSNYVYDVCKLKDDLYIGTNNGLAIYHKTTN